MKACPKGKLQDVICNQKAKEFKDHASQICSKA
jgi:hypothetical protein